MRILSTLAITLFIISAALFQHHAPNILHGIKDLGWFAPILFLLLYSLATLLLLPTLILTLAGGALFGPLLGLPLNLLGATLGAALAFCISRHWTAGWFALQKESKMNKFILGVEKKGWKFVALLRLLPIVPFNLVNYGLGLTQIKFSHYIIATFIFIIPAEIIYTYLGYAGMEVLIHQKALYKHLNLIILSLLGLFFLVYQLIKYYSSDGEKPKKN